MKIDKITINNFRQYYETSSIDLNVSEGENVILIGGRNGYGKTNFLLALVWCLYGEKISQVDDNFKKEVLKERNYQQFIKQTLNWDAEKEGKSSFFVEINISEIELPEIYEIQANKIYSCKIKREFNVNSMQDFLNIEIKGVKTDFLQNEDDKIDFINDYIVPLEVAKFVFFDAEKIASLAELTTKEEGNVMNDALGKLLGLDIYNSLISDLQFYASNLKKAGAKENIREQITNTENAIKLNEAKIEEIETEILETEKHTFQIKQKIIEYNNFLNNHSKKYTTSFDREELSKQIEKNKNKETQLEEKFNELSEIIPFAILAGNLEEVTEHLKKQNEINQEDSNIHIIKDKFETFVEHLFNKEPHDNSMTFKAKSFYYEKASDLFKKIFESNSSKIELLFEHDLNHADKELIFEIHDLIQQQTKDNFQQTIENYNATKNKIVELETTINQIDADLQDETVIEYSTKKEEKERKRDELTEKKGALENQKVKLKKDISKLYQKLEVLLNKIETKDKLKQKLEKTNLYISTLNLFIDEQKKQKEKSLSNSILKELQKLMHKSQQDSQFIEDVQVHTLPENGGLKVSLYDNDGNIIQKETLSAGEKQLYISSLIKAILSEAIQNFPIFIDTPLGRLDNEHINNVLEEFYPDLAKQVIILATNNEIPPSRYKLISKYVSNTYLLVNKNNRTSIKNDYFQSYAN